MEGQLTTTLQNLEDRRENKPDLTRYHEHLTAATLCSSLDALPAPHLLVLPGGRAGTCYGKQQVLFSLSSAPHHSAGAQWRHVRPAPACRANMNTEYALDDKLIAGQMCRATQQQFAGPVRSCVVRPVGPLPHSTGTAKVVCKQI